ncbi:MAG: DUF1592 domain-containing protein [Planctomycetota bacterium]
MVFLFSLHLAFSDTIDARADDQKSPDGTASAHREQYEKSIQPLLAEACFDCHSGDSVEGNFRADQLDPDLVNGGDVAWWLEVYSVLSKGEMPPPDASELTDAQRTLVVDWLSGAIQAAEKRRAAERHHSSFRRLTRYEYDYALQDLFGVPWTFAGDLPEEASEENAFENNAESLRMSAKQVEAYRELALKALRRVTVRGDRPAMVHWSIQMGDAFQRETAKLDASIKAAEKKLAEQPEEQAKQIERLENQFRPNANHSHYLELATGRKAKVQWSYSGAKYAFPHRDTALPTPELGSYFAVVQPGRRQSLTVELGNCLPDEGTMRVRVRASRSKDAGQTIPSLQLHFGFQATNEGRSVERVSHEDIAIAADWEKPKIYQWDVPLGEIKHRNSFRAELDLGSYPSPSEFIRFTNSTVEGNVGKTESPAILIDYVEVTAPIYKDWPPASHRSVFIGSERVDNETQQAREILADVMERVWRRAPANHEIERKLELFQLLRPSSNDFQAAMIEVLATVLSSPKFLYILPGQPGDDADKGSRISQHELATRLALFLWCSLPDATLRGLASDGTLADREVLQQQVERMLADPRASRFPEQFVNQWLKLRPLGFLRSDSNQGPLDDALLESMKREPTELFAHLLHSNANVMDLIDSNYVVINERLAEHYGIPGVRGNHFRRVPLPAEVKRGGFLTQAGSLTMNSDGQDSHPVKRGVWLLTSLLNDPPPPPPPAVPEIDLSDPEIAKLTLKERVEDHRNHAACFSCHQKIDPWGIALENYDAWGRWRDEIQGKTVDATSMLPNQVEIDGIEGLQQYLVNECDEQFVRATLEKMASFALGRQLEFGDRAEVNRMTRRIRESGDGLRTLVMTLVTSELFQTR